MGTCPNSYNYVTSVQMQRSGLRNVQTCSAVLQKHKRKWVMGMCKRCSFRLFRTSSAKHNKSPGLGIRAKDYEMRVNKRKGYEIWVNNTVWACRERKRWKGEAFRYCCLTEVRNFGKQLGRGRGLRPPHPHFQSAASAASGRVQKCGCH